MSRSGTEGATGAELRQHLVAILVADVAGYTRLMAADERATVAALDVARAKFREVVGSRNGRVIDTAGDSVLAVFEAVSSAVEAAVAVQGELAARAALEPEPRRMLFRIGVHLGDVIVKQDGSVYGDGVNVAARLQTLAPPGGVAVSQSVHAAAGPRSGVGFVDYGQHTVKNVTRPVQVFLLDDGGRLVVREAAPIRVGNLPVQTTSVIGRDAAVAELGALLEQARLITLLGMGGIGKTRLSIEVGCRVGGEFPDGVWFVDLAAVTDPAAIGLAVAGVFGVKQQTDKSITEGIVAALSARRLLVVLDNCEHVTTEAALLAHALLANCPQVRIVATSREALSVAGERVWQVPGLEVSGAAEAAVELFVARARDVVPGFLAGEDVGDIAEICRRLDGIPLAIELAAARVRSLGAKQILQRLNERFRLLTGGSRASAQGRHQTLRNTVQWSFDLLNAAEQAVVQRAAVFVGGFSIEAAEYVCAGGEVDELDVCDLLDSLVSKSLLFAERHHGLVRFGMLETIRSFGLETMGDEARQAARRSHAEFFARQSGEFFAIWRSPREREAYTWLDFEINNLRDAFRWAMDHGDVDVAAQIASDVGDMGRFRLREEAANWAEEVVERARAVNHRRLAVLLTWSASSAWAFSRFDDAKRFGEAAIALRDDPAYDPFIWAYGDLAFVSIFAGDIPGAIELLRLGAEHPTDRVDRFMMAFHLFIMATAGYADDAARIADDVLRKVDAAGVPMAVSVAYGAKGAAVEAARPGVALVAYEHAIEVARAGGCRFMEALIAPRLAALHARSGEPLEALRGFERMLVSFGEATDIASVSAWRASLVVLFAKLDRAEAAATLYGTFSKAIDAAGVVPELTAAVERLEQVLGAQAFVAAVERGAGMALREASDYAIVQVRAILSSLAG